MGAHSESAKMPIATITTHEAEPRRLGAVFFTVRRSFTSLGTTRGNIYMYYSLFYDLLPRENSKNDLYA